MSREGNNKKKYISVFIGMLLIVLAIGWGYRTYASAAVSGTITASTLFVRTGPSTEYPKVQVNGKAVFLSRGDSVAISHVTNGWYYVTASFEGTKISGYISAAYVLPMGAVPTAAPTSTPKPTATPKPTSAPSTGSGSVVTSGFPRDGEVTASTLNVRDGAGTNGTTVIAKLASGTDVRIQSAKRVDGEYWYQITYTQNSVIKTGYVSSQYIKAGPAPTPTPGPTISITNDLVTSGFPRGGTITASSLNLRSGPGTAYPVVGSISTGDAVTVHDVSKDSAGNYWYRVTFFQSGTEKSGYVSSKYVAVALPTATPKPTATPVPTKAPTPLGITSSTQEVISTGQFPRIGTVSASRLNVRKGPGTTYDSTALIINTTRVIVISAQKDSLGEYWYQISFTRDSVKHTGYVHSNYVVVDALATTHTPTPKPTVKPTATPVPGVKVTPTPTVKPTNTPRPTPTPVPSATPVPTPGGEKVYKSDLNDFFSLYFYRGMTRTEGAVIYEDPSVDARQVLRVKENVQLAVTSQILDGQYVWYRVAIKNNGEMTYGYMLSGDVDLNMGAPVYAQVIEDGVRLKNKPASNGSYIKSADNRIITLEVGSTVTIVSEITTGGEKWFEVSADIEGANYRGYVTDGTIFFFESPDGSDEEEQPYYPSEDPWGGSSYVPVVTATPTPTPTPTQGSLQVDNLPAPVTYNLSDGNYPVNRPGTVTGYGTTQNFYNRTLVAYQEPVYPYRLVCDNTGYFISLYGSEILVLYDKYVDSSNNVYRHVGFMFEGKMYYGYIDDIWITPLSDSQLKNLTDLGTGAVRPSFGGNMTGMLADFEGYMDQQGFPESYKPYLRELHEEYPNWVFEAHHTYLFWDDVIEEESIAGKNLISNSKSAEWKSFETGAYDWTTGTHIVYDGSTWVTASREAIEYYMDPRNFLNETNIYMFEVLRYAPDYQNEKGVENILNYTPFQYSYFNYVDDYGNYNVMSYAQAFVAAAEYSGVSPYHLASRVKQEVVTSSTTASNSVSGTVKNYEGLYNFYNIGAYHSTAAGGAIINGLKYAKNGASNSDELNDASLIPWTNQYNAIVGGAYILGENYINRGQDTIYLQKFNVTDTSTYYHQYMANVEAPYSESKKTASAYAGMEDLPIVFSIPVYFYMPEEAVAAPEADYDPNNWLKKLNVYDFDGNDLQLTPTFNMESDQVYYLVVEEEVDIIQIEAVPISSDASVLGTGFHGVDHGVNEIVVNVFAENGDIRNYEIIIVRQE